MMIGAAGSSETSLCIYQSTRCDLSKAAIFVFTAVGTTNLTCLGAGKFVYHRVFRALINHDVTESYD